jgi:uncharacterized protein (DUF427 family)
MTLKERTDKVGKLRPKIEIGSNVMTRLDETGNAYCYYNELQDSFEVFLKRRYQTSSEFSGQIEGHEQYPSNEAFGSWAWSYKEESTAMQRLKRLKNVS